MAVRAAGTAVVDTVADIVESGLAVVAVDTVLVAAVAADTVVVEMVAAVALSRLAAFHTCCRTLLQTQLESHTEDTHTSAASQPHVWHRISLYSGVVK